MPIDLAKAVGGGGVPEFWVSGTTYAVGEQVISPTDFGVYIRKLAGAGTTDPASDATNWQPFGGRAIKSVQRGIASSGNITISPVNPAKTEIRVLGWSPPSNTVSTAVTQADVKAFAGRVSLTNATTLTCAFSILGTASNGQVSWELTEYY